MGLAVDQRATPDDVQPGGQRPQGSTSGSVVVLGIPAGGHRPDDVVAGAGGRLGGLAWLSAPRRPGGLGGSGRSRWNAHPKMPPPPGWVSLS